MKKNIKIIIGIISLLVLIIIASKIIDYKVNKKNNPGLSQNEISVSCNDSNFEISLFSDKYEYKTNEKIKIWATLKYVGNNDQITIWHGEPYMLFSITDGKNFNSEAVVLTILKSTVLDKNKLYHFDYQKSGGYDADGPNADFWEKFYNEKDLLLPEGEYIIILDRGFSLSSNMQDNDYPKCELKIKVTK